MTRYYFSGMLICTGLWILFHGYWGTCANVFTALWIVELWETR